MHTTTLAVGCLSAARVSGVLLDPGATQKTPTPPLTSSPTIRSAQAWLAFGASAGVGRSARSASSGRVLRFSSRHSAAGSAAATTPTPAYSATSSPVGDTSALRMATANSAESTPTQPTGPAYKPRSKGSATRIASSAARLGWPHTAGVGCNAFNKSASLFPGANAAPKRAYRCCTEKWRRTPFSSSALTPPGPPFATVPSARRTSSRTMANSSCSLGESSISYASAASSPSSEPLGLVPATASDAACPSLALNSRSGVDPTNAAPSG
mmetsp:Transcript_10567/g.43772  ORF Transcript_10567/g.43772 Transcript_10567/m.43772 type:complete len:268 (-) Transcript_10567:1948-2751(-)